MSLADPTKKMSKSDENEQAYIAILDEPDVIVRKIKRAVTDSENSIHYTEERPGVANLMSIFGAVTGKNMQQIEDEFAEEFLRNEIKAGDSVKVGVKDDKFVFNADKADEAESTDEGTKE